MGYQSEEKESRELFRIFVMYSDGTSGYENIWAYSLEEAETKCIDLGFGL